MEQINETTPAEQAREELARTVAEHAEKVRAAMERTAITELKTDTGILKQGRYRSNVGTAPYLAWADGEPCGNLLEGRLSGGSGTDGYYLHGDFHAWVSLPSEEDCLCYANAITEIVQALNAAIESTTRNCTEASNRVKAAPGIV